MAAQYDVCGMGNAIVDILASVSDQQVEAFGFPKGSMNLIDEDQALKIYDVLGPTTQSSGGSCANTMAALASLGSSAGYIGRVRNDSMGEVFERDIRASGVAFNVPAAIGGPSTARSHVMVHEDAQRTMATYLGACVDLNPDDLDRDMIANASVLYLEGYLWDKPTAKAACIEAIDIAHGQNRQVSLTLSDSFCVGRWRDEFMDLIENRIDILFANEDEITSLFETSSFDEAMTAISSKVKMAAVTRGENGAVIREGADSHSVAIENAVSLVDTTGAGDAFAAGFLHGYVHDMGLATSGALGCRVAGQIIGHYGARPQSSLKPLIAA